MGKLTKLLIAAALAFSAAPAAVLGLAPFAEQKATPVYAATPLHTLCVGGLIFGDVDSNLNSNYYVEGDYTWQYLASSRKLILNNYKGPEIIMLNTNGDFAPSIDIFGECVVNVSSVNKNGFLFECTGNNLQPSFTFNDENSSLTINGGACGIKSICDGSRKIYFEGASTSKLNIFSELNGVDAGQLFLTNYVDAYINARQYGIIAPYSGSRTISGVSSETCSLTIISRERTALPVDYNYSDQPITMTQNFDGALEYVSSDNKVYHVASEDKYLQGFLQFTDLSGNLRAPNNRTVNINVGESETFGFNNMTIPSQMNGYKIERTLDYRKNGAEEPIYNVTNELNSNLSCNVSPNNIDYYLVRETLKLKQGANTLATVQELIRIAPIDTHAISTIISGLIIKPLSHPTCEVRTGETFQFSLSMEDYYLNSGLTLYIDGQELGYLHSSAYTIQNVRKDLVIYSDVPLSYKTNYKVYSGDKLIDQGSRNKGLEYTLPTLTYGQIPSGMSFDYWKVGDRTTHYSAGNQILFTEAERGEIRIEAHFVGKYNLTIEDGNFYSDSACTQVIGQAAQGSTVYFKFDVEKDVIIDGKMLYCYELECESSGVQIYEMDGYWQMYVPGNDVLIKPVYKIVIDELSIVDINVPISGEPLIEFKEHAPEEANYRINNASQLWYKVEGSSRTLLNIFDASNPYIFENDTTYELDVIFSAKDGYILNQNGFNRDDDYQLQIEGLNETGYEITDAGFISTLDKSNYEFTIRFNSTNRYAISVTNGSASINGVTVNYVAPGSLVLLSADVAPAGKAFDKWELIGVTVDDEASLGGSKLTITMPNNEVSAIATYKDVAYFEVTFNPNGGTGLISDDISYGDYTLPTCTFTAPEHKHFKAWDVNGTEYDELTNITVTSNIEVKAIWVFDEHVISFNANGGTGEMSNVTKEYGSSYVLPTNEFTAPAHKHFVGWALSSTGSVITDASIEITGNVELFAIWATDTHTITFTCTGGATGSMDPVVKEYNDTFTIPAPTFIPNDGKEFKHWEIDGVKVTTDTITITGDIALTAVYGDIPSPVTLSKIELSGTQKTSFRVGDTFTYEGLIVTAYYSDETSREVTEYTVDAPDLSMEGNKTVNVSYTEGGVTKTATYEITVVPAETPVVLDSISLSGTYKTEFEVGDTFSYDGLVVTAHYDGKDDAQVTGFTVSTPDMSTAGKKTVTVSYTEGGVTKTATYEINVKAHEEPPVDPEPETPSKGGLSGGAIAGIVIGSVLVAGIGGFALVWFAIKKKTWADFLALFKRNNK